MPNFAAGGAAATAARARKLVSQGADVSPRTWAEHNIGSALAQPVLHGMDAAGSALLGSAKWLGRGTANLAGSVGRAVTPLRLQEALGNRGIISPLTLDLSKNRHLAYSMKQHGLDVPHNLRSKWPGRLMYGGLFGLPAWAVASHQNSGSYDRLSDATTNGFREVMAMDNSQQNRLRAYLENATEKIAADIDYKQPQFDEQVLKSVFDTAGKTMGSLAAEVGKPLGQTLGYNLQRRYTPLDVRIRAPDIAATRGVEEFGKMTGTYAATKMQGLLDAGIESGREAAVHGPKRRAIYSNLMSMDPVISRADPESVLRAYHTMKRFAPLISTDPNAVQTFLREAVLHEGTVNYNTIGALSKAEAEAKRALGMM